MEVEKRIADLETHITNVDSTLLALALVVEAIIEAHPEPDSVGYHLEILLAQNVSNMRDHGFEAGFDTRLPQKAEGLITEKVNCWLGRIAAAATRR